MTASITGDLSSLGSAGTLTSTHASGVSSSSNTTRAQRASHISGTEGTRRTPTPSIYSPPATSQKNGTTVHAILKRLEPTAPPLPTQLLSRPATTRKPTPTPVLPPTPPLTTIPIHGPTRPASLPPPSPRPSAAPHSTPSAAPTRRKKATISDMNETAVCIVGHARTFEHPPVYSSHIDRVLAPLRADAFVVLDASVNHDAKPRHSAISEALAAFGSRLKNGLLFSPLRRPAIGARTALPLKEAPQVKLVRDAVSLRGAPGLSPQSGAPLGLLLPKPICVNNAILDHVMSQFGKVAACYEMVVAHEKEHARRYRYITFIRPDLYFAQAVESLDTLRGGAITMGWCHESVREPRICSKPPLLDSCEVPNDWLGAAPRDLAEHYLNFTRSMPSCHGEEAYACGCHAKHFPSFLPSECVIGAQLRTNHISFVKGTTFSKPMMLARVVDGWTVRSNTGVFARKFGLKKNSNVKWYMSHNFRSPLVGPPGPQSPPYY